MIEKKACIIRADTKLRNGYPNWWCFVHSAPARGEGGVRLDKCEKADLPPIQEHEKIFIDLDEYGGGVGIWGSLEPVYDTKREVPQKGVHVHLRKEEDGEKLVDNTFKEVYIKIPNTSLHNETEWIKIDDYTACAYTASIIFNRKMKILSCKHCNQHHVDADWFSVHAHKKHFCTFCGRDFIDAERGISNPVFYIQQLFADKLSSRKILTVDRVLKIKQKDYPGGIQIWASNPAIIWTAKRAEEAGIHVHLFEDINQPPVTDETYGKVEIDGVEIDDLMIRYYMVQKSLPYLAKNIVSLKCPKCNADHFDKEEKALDQHKVHVCESCNHVFEDDTKFKNGVVSNPIVAKLNQISSIREMQFQ